MKVRYIVHGIEILAIILIVLYSTVLPLNTVTGIVSIPASGTQTNTAQLPSCPGANTPGYGTAANYPRSPQHDERFHVLKGQLGRYKTSHAALASGAGAQVPGGCPFKVVYRLYL